MAQIAQQNRKDTAAAQADQSLDEAARAAGARAAAETERLANSASGNGSKAAASLLEILSDQTRHAFESAAALGRARNFTEVAQVQSDFLGGSLTRMGTLNERSLELLRQGMMSLPSRR